MRACAAPHPLTRSHFRAFSLERAMSLLSSQMMDIIDNLPVIDQEAQADGSAADVLLGRARPLQEPATRSQSQSAIIGLWIQGPDFLRFEGWARGEVKAAIAYELADVLSVETSQIQDLEGDSPSVSLRQAEGCMVAECRAEGVAKDEVDSLFQTPSICQKLLSAVLDVKGLPMITTSFDISVRVKDVNPGGGAAVQRTGIDHHMPSPRSQPEPIMPFSPPRDSEADEPESEDRLRTRQGPPRRSSPNTGNRGNSNAGSPGSPIPPETWSASATPTWKTWTAATRLPSSPGATPIEPSELEERISKCVAAGKVDSTHAPPPPPPPTPAPADPPMWSSGMTPKSSSQPQICTTCSPTKQLFVDNVADTFIAPKSCRSSSCGKHMPDNKDVRKQDQEHSQPSDKKPGQKPAQSTVLAANTRALSPQRQGPSSPWKKNMSVISSPNASPKKEGLGGSPSRQKWSACSPSRSPQRAARLPGIPPSRNPPAFAGSPESPGRSSNTSSPLKLQPPTSPRTSGQLVRSPGGNRRVSAGGRVETTAFFQKMPDLAGIHSCSPEHSRLTSGAPQSPLRQVAGGEAQAKPFVDQIPALVTMVKRTPDIVARIFDRLPSSSQVPTAAAPTSPHGGPFTAQNRPASGRPLLLVVALVAACTGIWIGRRGAQTPVTAVPNDGTISRVSELSAQLDATALARFHAVDALHSERMRREALEAELRMARAQWR